MSIDEMIAVLQAAKEGKVIQLKHITEHSWREFEPGLWNFVLYEYRVKQEPRVIYVNEYPSFIGNGVYESESEAVKMASPGATRLGVRFIEDLSHTTSDS